MSTVVEHERCHHCGGTGYEPPTAEEREALLQRLRAIGAERATVSTSRKLDGIIRREQLNEDIRVLAAEAQRLKISRAELAEAAGMAKATLYLVLTRKSYG